MQVKSVTLKAIPEILVKLEFSKSDFETRNFHSSNNILEISQ